MTRLVCFLCLSMPMLIASPWALSKDILPTAKISTSRLPAFIRPKAYELYLEPDLTQCTFTGHETILINVHRPITAIVLNATELTISKATVHWWQANKAQILEGNVASSPNLEQVSIVLPHALSPGSYKLQLAFQGKIGDKLRGFYMAHYNDAAGIQQKLAVTQMEPTDARRLFPCFDEPAFKATFRLTVAIDPALTAVSNSPIVSQQWHARSGKKIIAFAATPKMSTYLVTLIVGHLEATPVKMAIGKVPIQVWTVPGKSCMGRYAQEIAARLLEYYNNYFKSPYPAPKLDLIAVPDFEAGAMENLGAITFRETALLVDEKTASTQTRQEVAEIVAHEMAHLWFGDLVTMKWWDDLWLNEAFATWMSTKAVDKLMPGWHVWDDFHLWRMRAMTTDALQSSRPIHFPVHNALQANEMFDEITYVKGASILRMLETFVGETIFQSGIVNFIKQHALANADTNDLWSALQRASQYPVQQMMSSWVNQPGYPLLSLSLIERGRKITLHQRRFLLDSTEANNTLMWYMPVELRTLATNGQLHPLSKTRPVHRLNVLPQINQTFALPQPTKVVIANADANGYYRVHYGTTLLKTLVPLLQTTLSPA
ncbi:MAG: M1 family peptidase, partial [Candidatus Melainabacteria bacterium]|nr:M1 family peptidase [Candidatus Melainabacteria bacterium]